MKPVTTSLFAAALLFASTAFATTSTAPSVQAQATFNRLFAGATAPQWQAVSNLYEVSFEKDGQYLTAFINPAGGMESLSRNIVPTALPLLLQKELQEKKGTGWITETFELVGKSGTEYYITVENNEASTVYRATGSDWNVYKKTKK